MKLWQVLSKGRIREKRCIYLKKAAFLELRIEFTEKVGWSTYLFYYIWSLVEN